MSFDISEVKDVCFLNADGEKIMTLSNACISADVSFDFSGDLPIYNFEVSSCGPITIEKQTKKEKEFKVMYGDSSL